MLSADHAQHLRNEGFNDEHITQVQALGVCTIDEATAAKRNLKVNSQSSSGLYFPFTKTFGQLRADTPPLNKHGKPCKYITPGGATSQAYIPDGCQVITEGFKDAIAGCFHGGIPTGALAGVSHFRKALKPGAGYTVLFDADGWINAQVFAQLIHAAFYLNGKVVLVPPIDGEPKAGLCEYFKAGNQALDYQRLLESAQRPKKMLMEWPQHWADATQLAHCSKVAIALGVQYLNFMEQEALLVEVAKASKIRKTSLNKQLARLRSIDERREKAKELKAEKLAIGVVDSDLIPDNYTVEKWIYETVFGGDGGDWAVIDDIFHRYQPDKGYWIGVPDQHVERLITHKLMGAYTEIKTKNFTQIKMQGTDHNRRASMALCRSALQNISPPRNRDFIAFRQCTVDVRTGAAVPHDKSYYLTTCIEADYHPELDPPPAFKAFIAKTYGEDLEEMIRASLSMLADPSAPYGKLIHLKGPSGTGKGTLMDVIRAIFGRSYRSGTDFSVLNSAEKRHQFLNGCSVYAFGDVSGYLAGLNGLYELTDNQAMDGRALRSSSGYSKKWNIRFVVGSVSHLRIENSGEGWGRRALILPTNPRCGAPDPRLKASVLDEIPAIVAWALGMDRERRNELLRDPESHCERISQELSEAKLSADPISRMLDRCLRPATDAELAADNEPATLENEELYAYYLAFANAHRYTHLLGDSEFIQRLSSAISMHRVKRKRVNGSMRSAHWRWLRPIPGVFLEADGEIINGQVNLTYNPVKAQPGGLEEFEAFQNSGGAAEWRSTLPQPEAIVVESNGNGNGHHETPMPTFEPVTTSTQFEDF